MYKIIINDLCFDWDVAKKYANIHKHKVSFEEAATAFLDEDALIRYDDAHSLGEERLILLGKSDAMQLLVVTYCLRDGDEVIRIISARKAGAKEKENYLTRRSV